MEENKLTLYQISDKFIELLSKDDLTPEEVQERGNELALMLQNKAESIVGYNANLKANKVAVKQEIDRLTKIYDAIEKQEEKLNKYVKENMEKLDLSEINTPIGNIKIKKCPPSVKILDEDLIDDKYIVEKITASVSKTKIKEDLQKGIDVKGAILYQDTRLDFN